MHYVNLPDGVSGGFGRIRVSLVNGQSVATEMQHRAPVRVVCSKPTGPCAWFQTTSFGGGLVQGDQIKLHVQVDDGAAAFVSTPGHQRAYRGHTEALVEAHVGPDALLVFLPEPISCFENATHRQRALVHLAPGASVVWVDAWTSGRYGTGERFAFGELDMRTELHQGQDMLAVEALNVRPDRLPPGSFGPFQAFGALLAVGPRVPGRLALDLGPEPSTPESVCSAFAHGPVRVVRAAGKTADALMERLRSFVSPWPESLLGPDPLRRHG
jgi:urease accessory protein